MIPKNKKWQLADKEKKRPSFVARAVSFGRIRLAVVLLIFELVVLFVLILVLLLVFELIVLLILVLVFLIVLIVHLDSPLSPIVWTDSERLCKINEAFSAFGDEKMQLKKLCL